MNEIIGFMLDMLGYVFIVAGVIFNLFGCIGLVRLPDVYSRLQAATKSAALGTCGILCGVFLVSGAGAWGGKTLLAVGLLLLTAPTAAHALSRAAHKAGIKLWEKSVCDKYQEDGQ